MPTKLSMEKAAQAWCKETTEHLVMQPELAMAFAEILDEIWSQAWLGNATTAELLDEIRTRCEINGTLNYRTVDGEETQKLKVALREIWNNPNNS